jgi:hypothetical protein
VLEIAEHCLARVIGNAVAELQLHIDAWQSLGPVRNQPRLPRFGVV